MNPTEPPDPPHPRRVEPPTWPIPPGTHPGPPDFAAFAIAHKDAAVAADPRPHPGLDSPGGLPPVVRAYRDGRLLATIAATRLDPDDGFRAAHMARHTLAADHLVCAFDTLIKLEHEPRPGRDEAPDRRRRRDRRRDHAARRRFPPGQFQAWLRDPYAREREQILESLAVLDIHAHAPCRNAFLPYHTDPGPPLAIRWHRDRFRVDHEDSQVAMGGRLVSVLRQILRTPPDDRIQAEMDDLADQLGLDPLDRRQAQDHGALRALASLGYRIADVAAPPEPTRP